MNTKLIKSTVRASGNTVYVGRCYRPRNNIVALENVTPFTAISGSGFPAAIPVSQRYMKIAPLSRQ